MYGELDFVRFDNDQFKEWQKTLSAGVVLAAFRHWQSAVEGKALPDCRRYQAEFLERYKEQNITPESDCYKMFLGFLGGLDLMSMILSTETRESNEEN